MEPLSFLPSPRINRTAERVAAFPRLRYMGSKYRMIPALLRVFESLPFDTALDAFSGSGVVAYTLKVLGKQVTANDFLHFAHTVAHATIENAGVRLESDDVDEILADNSDGRDFIQRTFAGLYFPDADHDFLDSAWSRLDHMAPYKRSLALAALCLAAARKQPRGVFTVTDLRYDDGRRAMRTPLRDLFGLAAGEYNRVVFDNGRANRALCADVFALDPSDYDLVYFDPPYAPPKDDTDYIKRYHFLEGLSVYWRGQTIMEDTATKKIVKRYTPFAYKHTIRAALGELFTRFQKSIIVLSYSSNSVPDGRELRAMLESVKPNVEVHAVPHLYSFGTHAAAVRRQAEEYIFVAR